MSRHMPGLTWRVLAHRRRKGSRNRFPALDLEFGPKDGIEFDEIVACEGAIHIEQMGDRDWCVLIYTPTDADPHARWMGNLHVPAKGPASMLWHETPADDPEDD